MPKWQLEPIDFFSILTCDLLELVEGNTAISIDTAVFFTGSIHLIHSQDDLISISAFKTCKIAHLNLYPLRIIGCYINHEATTDTLMPTNPQGFFQSSMEI